MVAWLLWLFLLAPAQAVTTCTDGGAEVPVAVTAVQGSPTLADGVVPLAAELTVQVRCLQAWLDDHQGQGTCDDKVRLVLDGQRLDSLPPTRCGFDDDGTTASIEFRLKGLDRTDPSWKYLMRTRGALWTDSFAASLSWEGEEPIQEREDAVHLALLELASVAVGGLVVLFVAALLVALARRTNLLKEWARIEGEEDAHRWAWSLARTQAAWWFFVTFAVWMFLSIAEGRLVAFTDGAVGMLALSSGTLVVGGSATAPVKPKEARFWGDLVYLDTGPSLSRLQNVVWTLVFGFGFAWMSVRDLSMAEITTTMLTLMGVVNGAYVGAKATKVA
jgi:low affinity Fe/Cu permease